MQKPAALHISSFALACFLLVLPAVPYLEYYLFQDYIAQELCVNKDKPELHCQGKCWLGRELAKLSPQKEELPNKQFVSAPEVNLSLDAFTLEPQAQQKPMVARAPKPNCRFGLLYRFIFLTSPWQPPEFTALHTTV